MAPEIPLTISLTDFKLLSFDVYGTLVDWEAGILAGLQPILNTDRSISFTNEHLISTFHELESAQQTATPSMPYSNVLATVYGQLAEKLGFPAPSKADSEAFGNSVGGWPAFPDTVEALHRLSKTYKLVVLSNVDNASFKKCNAGPLAGVKFDAVLTAEMIGSYKPDPRNFAYMLDHVKRELGVEKNEVLQTAQSIFHDHQPAQKAGIKSVWIARKGAKMGDREGVVPNGTFSTLGEMADAVDRERKEKGL